MIGKLLGFIAPYKSYIFAFVGVVALCGIFTTAYAALYISKQRETMAVQKETIEQWTKNWATLTAVREIDRESVAALQSDITALREQSAEFDAQLNRMEQNDVEVKDYLSQQLPASLRGMLNKP